MSPSVTLVEVSSDNWRDVADLAPRDGTSAVGHVMWGTDEDGSRWIGGLLVDAAHQGRGLGRAIVQELVSRLGFRHTGVVEDGELVMELGPDRPAGV
jgi:diamine N-acetyltransferase